MTGRVSIDWKRRSRDRHSGGNLAVALSFLSIRDAAREADVSDSDNASTERPYHISVLPVEVVQYLGAIEGGRFLDATLGGGGHTEALLAAGATEVVGLDRDAGAIAEAQRRLQPWLERGDRQLRFEQVNFAEFESDARFDGVIADLGVSSAQLDRPDRGFSFRQDGPLDMRMDSTSDELTASEWLDRHSEADLVKILSEFGEERYSRRIAKAVMSQLPLRTTAALADAVSRAVPPAARYGKIHPATRVFQALRIAVNGELEALDRFLERSPEWVKPGGAIAIISFHSLEDRRVKWHFRRDDRLEVVTKKPIRPSPEELSSNSRSRSAKLRVAKRKSAPH
ncbi:MAG: 16S rRNA (cytosine(1402)-N(4))-methyltransferase RsmH [Cyanobacteria bacterium J06639_1]